MGLLMLLGLIIMYAIGPQRANVLNNATGTNYSGTYFFVKQCVSLLLAAAAFVVLATVPFAFIKKYAAKLLLFGFGACLVLAIAGALHLGIAQCSLGACRWFNLPGIGTLQPAELVKFGLLAFLAGFLAMRVKQGLINDRDKTLIPVGLVVLIGMGFIIGLQKDMGTGIAMTAIVASMMMIAGTSKKVGGLLLLGSLILGVVFIVTAPHRIDRVATFFSGSSSGGTDASYHIDHAKIAIGTGFIFGVGIGNSVQATGYLPEAINDSVFAIMGETFGFIGLCVILLIFTALLMRLLRVVDHLPDMWMKLVVAGVFGWLASHVILNVASMIGVFPLTGITLPLLSFGGTSMIFIAAALGLAFQMSRYTIHGSLNKENSYENPSSRRGVGRTRYASRRSTPRA
jgi:cell division protein FtsW